MNAQALELLLTRRSVLSRNLSGPGPNAEQLQTILTAATRVPDHRKLEPWRFIVVQGEHRKTLGEQFCQIRQQTIDLAPEQISAEQNRYNYAPLVIVVVFSPVEHKTPEFEQLLSCGAACQHINLASNALGFASQWVTNWCAYDKQAYKVLNLSSHESIAGFFHIGTSTCVTKDRSRPDLSKKVSYFEGIE